MNSHWFGPDVVGPDVIAPVMVFAIPIVAIAGGILASVVKTISAHRLMEAALRERMALIARGVDPSRIPPASLEGSLAGLWPLAEFARFRAQGLLIGGFVTLAAGAALGVFLLLVDSWSDGSWSVALIPVSIGVALIASGLIVWPRGHGRLAGTSSKVG